MRRDLIAGVVAMVAFTLLLGVAYPLVVTGAAQVAYPTRADGSPVRDARGKVIGSRLQGRAFVRAGTRAAPDPRFFQGRPSATGYSPSATSFSNRAPNSAAARVFYRDNLRAYVELNRPGNPGLSAAQVPVDAVESSASGVDPHISPANAAIQARRVARVRGLPLDRVMALVEDHTDARFLGIFGERGVDYSLLNDALGREASR